MDFADVGYGPEGDIRHNASTDMYSSVLALISLSHQIGCALHFRDRRRVPFAGEHV